MDLGSNTVRLLVARVGRDAIEQVLGRELAAPRLGRGLMPGQRLLPAARAEALAVLAKFTRRARDLGAQRVALGATQACRAASDGAEFVASLGRELGLERAQVLSGEEEARLSRLGVLSRLSGPAKGALLADVGGGSSELVELGRADAPAISLPLGAVSLTEAHLKGDPPRLAELKALDQAVDQGLAPVRGRRAERLVVCAGTASTLASLLLGLEVYQPERIDNLLVPLTRLEEEAARLATLPLAERRRALKLDPARADIIIAGLAIVRGLLRLLSLREITAMDSGLLEGILLDDLARA